MKPLKGCPKCLQFKELTEFHVDSKTRDGRTASCKECRCHITALYKQKHKHTPEWKEKQRAKNVKYTYGLDRIAYTTLLEQQNNKCGICKNTLTLSHVDHNHTTGKVRGILCHTCNVGLGMFKDNPSLLDNAKLYLEAN